MRIPQIVTLGLGLACLTPVVGTQVVAHLLRYPAWLGAPWLQLGRLWLYAPWQVGAWYWHYDWYYPAPFNWALTWMSVWMVVSAVVVARLLKREGWGQPVKTDVEWAGTREIRRAGLFVRIKK